jgi:hypothetical protein
MKRVRPEKLSTSVNDRIDGRINLEHLSPGYIDLDSYCEIVGCSCNVTTVYRTVINESIE